MTRKQRILEAAKKEGVSVNLTGVRMNVPTFGKPFRLGVVAPLNAHYGLKGGGTITVALLKRVADTLGDSPKPGERALTWLKQNEIYEGPYNNRGAILDSWWKEYDPDFLGQPWCGLAVWKSYKEGAGIDLRDSGVIYTPAGTAFARSRGIVKDKFGNRYVMTPVSPNVAQPGDIVFFDWQRSGLSGPSSAADHVGLARGPAKGGMLPTIEGNTRPGPGGDQSGHGGGDGVYERERSLDDVLLVATLVPIK